MLYVKNPNKVQVKSCFNIVNHKSPSEFQVTGLWRGNQGEGKDGFFINYQITVR